MSLLKALKSLEGHILPPNSQIWPLKNELIFTDCASKGPQKCPYISAHRQFFQKGLSTTYFSSASGLEDKPGKCR